MMDPYMKALQAFYTKKSPIPPPTIIPLSSMPNPQEFLSPKKQGRSSSSTSSLPQAFEIEDPSYITGGELEYPRELFLGIDLHNALSLHRHYKLRILVCKVLCDARSQGTISSIPIGGSISPEGFLPPILLLVVIIVTVVIVAVILVVVVVAIVGVVIVLAIIRVVVVGVSELLGYGRIEPLWYSVLGPWVRRIRLLGYGVLAKSVIFLIFDQSIIYDVYTDVDTAYSLKCYLMSSLSDEEIPLDAASSEGSMSRPGSGGEEGDYVYDMTNYHDDY
ncbi:hypothetical protein Tco_0266913 [Tanacetum coccineum]